MFCVGRTIVLLNLMTALTACFSGTPWAYLADVCASKRTFGPKLKNAWATAADQLPADRAMAFGTDVVLFAP